MRKKITDQLTIAATRNGLFLVSPDGDMLGITPNVARIVASALPRFAEISEKMADESKEENADNADIDPFDALLDPDPSTREEMRKQNILSNAIGPTMIDIGGVRVNLN